MRKGPRLLPARSAAPLAVVLAALPGMALAQAPVAAPAAPAARATAPAGDFAVRCGRLLVGDGTELRDAWLLVREGKVAAVGGEAPPPELPVVDAGSRVVMPGIVAVDTDLSQARDDDYAVTPDVLALDGFDFERSLRAALEGGVTTAYLSPGRERLVSGQGAVVKTAGRDLVGRVLADAACLRVNFGDGAVAAPAVFEPGPHPTDEDPLVPARLQTPTARIAVLPELRALFAEAVATAGPRGSGPVECRYDAAALRRAAAGDLPVRAAAHTAADIRRALLLQHELGIRMVLEDPREIAPLLPRVRQQGLAAVFRVPVPFGGEQQDREDRRQEAPEPRLDAPARAAAAGLTIGLAPAASVPLRDYLPAVGFAVRGGLPVPVALRAIGADAARILGVEQRVGTLFPGRDADFVVLSGDPFAIGTMVESTWIDGRRVYERHVAERLLAIRCGKILDGEGNVHRSGVLIVQAGRIKAVGEDLSIPYGARVVDLPGAVMTPGFLDAFSHLGLAGDGKGVPNGQSGPRLHEAIPFDDPMFGPALAEGITTVLASGKDGGVLSGRIAAVKTGARDRAGMVVRAIAGQRAVFDAIGPEAIKPLRDQLDRGRRYAELWAKYEQALADWKAGKKPAEPAAEAAPPAEAEAAPPDPVTGTWEATIDLGPFEAQLALDLKLEGTKVTGQARFRVGEGDRPPVDVDEGSFENGRLRLAFRLMGQSATLEGTIEGDTLEGTVSLGPMGERQFTARRTSQKPGAGPRRVATSIERDEETGEPKRPDVDENLEPLRAVLEKRAPLVVRTTRGAAIAAVVALLEEAEVAYVLQDAAALLDGTAPLGSARPPVLLEPGMVERDGLEVVNAAARLSELELPLLFGTGACAAARFLPQHAAYAVRYGLGPEEALAAITANVARAFRIDDRVGSLQKGKDADFAVFSGDPFEPTSRVLLVGCNGEIVVDNREEGR